MEIPVQVRTVVCEAKKRIVTCESSRELADIISQFVFLLGINVNSPKEIDMTNQTSLFCCGINYTEEFKKEFLSRHYICLCEYVVTQVDPRFLDDDKFRDVLSRLFLDGPADFTILALVSLISLTTHSNKLYQIVAILDSFASSGKFSELITSQCCISSSKMPSSDLLLAVASLPDKLANKIRLGVHSKFHPNSYYCLIGMEIQMSLTKVHNAACQMKEYSTEFLSNLIGKIALRGSVSVLLDALLPQVKEWSYTSPLWSSICSNLFMAIPGLALEPVIENLLKKITFFPFFCKILKDAIFTNKVINHLITHKFLLVRYYKEPNILQNIMGFLCSDGKRSLLVEVLKKMLSHWGNPNTIKHSSYDQHFYVTQAIILAVVQMNEHEIEEHKNNLLHKMLSGVQAHLNNPNKKIRQLGMMTAECVTARFHPDGQQLKFEYDEDADVEKLRCLAASPRFGTDMEKGNFLNVSSVTLEKPSGHNIVNGHLSFKDNETNDAIAHRNKSTCNESEDDDDLQPYEMSEGDNDLIEGIKPPRYISQCIEGLLSGDDRSRHIASLRVLKDVVKSDQDNLPYQCVQLATVLLHLPDKYALEDYTALRFAVLVEITVQCPKTVSDHLTKEFYAPNYSLRQRLDVLDVLAAAASRLTKPETSHEQPRKHNLASELSDCRNWQTVVQERLEKKTRRFSKKSAVVTPKATVNKFSSVAGNFFFPLLQGFDNQQNTFDLFGEDCMVLGSLVCTLGNIMWCARGTLVAQNMVKAMVDFVWVLRYHGDSHVRQGLLFALAMAMVSVPGFFLVTELPNELVECQNWLENVFHNDPSAQCRDLAFQVLISIRDIFQKQFSPD